MQAKDEISDTRIGRLLCLLIINNETLWACSFLYFDLLLGEGFFIVWEYAMDNRRSDLSEWQMVKPIWLCDSIAEICV